MSDLVDRLERMIDSGQPLPPSDEVRISARDARKLADALHAAAPTFGDGEAAAELERLMREARSVPLTGRVRLDQEVALALVERLRASEAGA